VKKIKISRERKKKKEANFFALIWVSPTKWRASMTQYELFSKLLEPIEIHTTLGKFQFFYFSTRLSQKPKLGRKAIVRAGVRL
jgi:hypothetical protein